MSENTSETPNGNEQASVNKEKKSYKDMKFGERERHTWFFNVPGDIGGGLVATFCLLPEVIGFMIAVGIPPYMGLFTCIVLTATLSFVGGRPGLITACAGATATICTGLISKVFMNGEHPEYLFAAVILAGIIQIILGLCKFGKLVSFIPDCVMKGFVNGLATIILISQIKMILREDTEFMPMQLGLIALGIGIIVAYKFLKKKVNNKFLSNIPEAIVGVIVVAAIGICVNLPVMRLSDLGSVVPEFTYFGSVFKNIGGVFTLDCFVTILPVSLSVAFIGLVETMLTARVVGEISGTKEMTNLNRECRGQGIGNIVCGLLGTMPGCAMIAPSTANVKSGGKGRFSSIITSATMAVLLFGLSPLLSAIPLAALVAVMLYTCFETYNWESIFKCAKIGLKDTMCMLIVVVIVLATDNLAFGVICGVIAYYAAFLLNFFVSTKKGLVIAFVLFAAGCVLLPFGVGTIIGGVLGGIGVCITSANLNGFDHKVASGIAVALNAILFCGAIALVVINSYIIPGALPCFSMG